MHKYVACNSNLRQGYTPLKKKARASSNRAVGAFKSQLPPAEAGGLACVGWKPTEADIIRLP